MRHLKQIICIFAMISLLVGCSADQKNAQQTTEQSEIELNYAKGIEEGVYGWTLSEDQTYYMLSAIDEDGTPTETEMQNPMMMRPGKSSGDSDNFRRGRMQQSEEDPLAMEQNEQALGERIHAQGVCIENNITNLEYQTMLVFVPAEYMTIDENGQAVFTDTQIGEYTAESAPIVFQNNNMGWRSGSAGTPEYADALKAGMIYVSCGSRSRDAESEDGTQTGKAPTPVVDLKAGIIAIRANADVIPGDKDKIVSVGASGGGEMSSVLGATGNMENYYPYLYEAGAIGVSYDEETGKYESKYDDSVYAAMSYCPIADIENADLAYAWMRYDSTEEEDGSLSETAGEYTFSEFQLEFQKDAAYAFAEYIDSLGLTDENGTPLTFDKNEDGSWNLRKGTYYDAFLQNISDALNATRKELEDPLAYIEEQYGSDFSNWLTIEEDGTYRVTDLAGFITATNLVRNKDIPGFDALNLSAENNAFGTGDEEAVHYSVSVAKVLQENYNKYKTMDGFDASQIDLYNQNALTGEEAQAISEQTYLMNGTQILLNIAKGTENADVAKYWRTRNGTADEHTSFTIAYNLCVAAQMAGAQTDYSLVWGMKHGSNEGTTTGTFVDWIQQME